MSQQVRSLRGQLLIAFVSLIVLGFGGLTLFAGRQLSAGALEDFESRLQIEALLVAAALHEPVEEFLKQEVGDDEVAVVVAQLANETNTRITLLHLDGSGWITSEGDLPDVGESAEVQAALNNEVIYELRDLDGEPTLFSAAPVIDHNAAMAIAHLTVPAADAQAAVQQRWIALFGVFLALTLAALLVSLYLSASLTRPLRRLQTTALHIADGDLQQRIETSRMDEIGDLGRAFNQMAERVEQMLEEQRAFASNASHELRTPLTTMRLRVERLQSGQIAPEKMMRYSAEIEQELLRLTRLVEDLGTLSRVDSERMEIGQERVDAKRVAEAVLRELAPLRDKQQITVTLLAPAPVVVQANMSHLRLVLRNLLENALKYTPQNGHVNWWLSATEREMVCEIQDDGVGISVDDLPHLFKRFYRVDKARNRRVSGSGLGLSLVQAVVEQYGGHITIHSKGAGRGTTATVVWPLMRENDG